MKPVVIALVFLVAAGVTAYFMGVFDAPPPDEPNRPPAPAPTPGDGVRPLEGPPSAEPVAEPPVEYPALTKAVTILLVGGVRGTWNAWLTQQWDARETIRYRSWFQTLRPGDTPSQTAGLPPLVENPGPEALEDVDVVVLHGVDASKLRSDFLDALAKRVADGTTGLLAMPDFIPSEVDPAGPRMTWLDQPTLAAMLPVAKVKPIRGQPVPGVLDGTAPYVPTEEGIKHVATRFVSYPGWSRKKWEAVNRGTPGKTHSWGTKFVYPVEELKKGSVTLLEIDPGRGAPKIPAVVQGASETGRVLWVGLHDFGDAPYYDSRAGHELAALTLSWIDWLRG